MGIWIRSQDKSCLVEAKRVIQAGTRIVNQVSYSYDVLGDYNTDEEAKRALDNVHNFIEEQIRFERNCQYGHAMNAACVDFVFQMPTAKKKEE